MKQLLPLELLISLCAIILCRSVDTLFNYLLIECSTKTQNKPTSQPMNKRKNFQKMLAPPLPPPPPQKYYIKEMQSWDWWEASGPEELCGGPPPETSISCLWSGGGWHPPSQITLSNPWPCRAGSPVHMVNFHLTVGAQQPALPCPTSAPTWVPLQTPPPARPLPLSSQRGRGAGGGLSVEQLFISLCRGNLGLFMEIQMLLHNRCSSEKENCFCLRGVEGIFFFFFFNVV